MNWTQVTRRIADVRRNLATQQRLMAELLANPDSSMADIEQARHYARKAIENQQYLDEIEKHYEINRRVP